MHDSKRETVMLHEANGFRGANNVKETTYVLKEQIVQQVMKFTRTFGTETAIQ